MQAVAHTLILLLILPLCLGICARYRVRNVTGIQLIRRLSLGIVAAFATAAVPLVFFLCKCGVGNNPMRQVFVPAIGAWLCVAALGSRRSRWLSAAVLLAASVGLAWHFQSLVLPRDPTALSVHGRCAIRDEQLQAARRGDLGLVHPDHGPVPPGARAKSLGAVPSTDAPGGPSDWPPSPEPRLRRVAAKRPSRHAGAGRRDSGHPPLLNTR